MKENNNPGTTGPGMDRDDILLEKNRISGIEPAAGEIKEGTQGRFDKKPLIILSVIVAVLLAAIFVLTQFVFKKPAGFAPSSTNPNAPFDERRSEENLKSENPGIQRGRESYSRGYLTDAIAEFDNVVESDATDRDKAIALIYLGMIGNDKGDYDSAEKYFTRALTYDKNNPDIYKNLSITYRRKKEFDKAIESAAKSVSIDTGDSDAKILLGNVYFETGKYDEAIETYRQALDGAPNNPRLLYNLASALMMKGDEFAAMEYFKKAAAADRIGEVAHRSYSRLGVMYTERKEFAEAEKYLKEAVAIRPNDALNRYNLGIAYLRQNKKEEAIEELAKAEALGESNAAVLENIGEAYFSMKQYDRSLEVYNRVKKTGERNVKILARIAEIYYEKGELDSAYEMYRKITVLEPATENARVAYLNMGNILDDANRFDEAVEAYRKALAISPKDHTVYYNLGIAYRHAEKPELAVAAWKKAAELDPNDSRPAVAIADYYYERGYYDLAETEYRTIVARWPNIQEPHFKMGTMYYKRGNFDYALNAYNRVIELEPNSDLGRRALINKAILISKTETGDEGLDKAMSLIQKAILMKPEDPEALFALGIIYMKKEMYDNATDTFYQVVKSAADNRLVADAYNNIGKCYFKKKQYKKALQAFTRGIEEDPESEELRLNRKAATQAYEAALSRE